MCKSGAFFLVLKLLFLSHDLEGGDLRNTFEGGARGLCFWGVVAFVAGSVTLLLWVE